MIEKQTADELMEHVRKTLNAHKVIIITMDANGVGVGTLGFLNRCEAVGTFELGKHAYTNATERSVIQPPPETKGIVQ